MIPEGASLRDSALDVLTLAGCPDCPTCKGLGATLPSAACAALVAHLWEAGRTKKSIADAAGITEPCLYKMEHGMRGRRPSAALTETLVGMCLALGMTEPELVAMIREASGGDHA